MKKISLMLLRLVLLQSTMNAQSKTISCRSIFMSTGGGCEQLYTENDCEVGCLTLRS